MGQDVKATMVQGLRHLLKPILRFCVRHSIAVQDIIEAVKIVLIEAAAEELELSGQGVNVSRLRVATGMHRRDVVRIYREGSTREHSGGLLSDVIGQWQQDDHFLTRARKPRVLSLEGDDCEFNRLVRSVSVDVHPSSVLGELVRLGAATETSHGLRLDARGYLPKGDPREGLRLLGEDSQMLFTAVEENIFDTKSPPNLHIRTDYDNVSISDLPQIRSWLFREGSAFHQKARNFLSRFDIDLHPKKGKRGGARVVLGSFSWAGTGETEAK